MRPAALPGCAALLALAAGPGLAVPAGACADSVQRHAAAERLSQRRMEIVEAMRFGDSAMIAGAEINRDPVEGRDWIIDGNSTRFSLSLDRRPGRMVFTLNGDWGHETGVLTLTLPKKIGIFAVDTAPDEEGDRPTGPMLYRQWRLTGAIVGTGIFRRAAGMGQKATLILHGRGNGCLDADNFYAWSLLLHGPVGKTTLYGPLNGSQVASCWMGPCPDGRVKDRRPSGQGKRGMARRNEAVPALRTPLPPPAKMELYIGGFSGPNYTVSLIAGTDTVRYRSNPQTFIRPHAPGTRERVLAIPPRRWQVFRDRLDAAGLWAWRKEYRSAALDGTQWSVAIVWHGRKIEAGGSNDYPAGFRLYKQAVRELLGGEEFE
ncbi:MAG: hypothetical protein LBV50_10530 [Novosphingobium sp.]|jgi:hypothetical protein|nr:hypothetical protein [Novosphingobium sp.]